jgi:hypothetical protein
VDLGKISFLDEAASGLMLEIIGNNYSAAYGAN